MKKSLFLLLLAPTSLLAQVSPVTTPAPNITPVPITNPKKEIKEKSFKSDEKHWLFNFGFEGMRYELPWEFRGITRNYKVTKQELYGVRAGFGGELNIGKGLMTATLVDAYFLGTAFTKAKTAEPDLKVEFASAKKTGQIMGIEASQRLSYLFDYKTENPFMDYMTYLTFEPFIEAGVGAARAYNRVNFIFDATETGSVGTPTERHEAYRHSFEDTLVSSRIGAGFNVISSKGFVFFAKVAQANYLITDRKQSGFRKQNGQNPEKITGSPDDDPFSSIVYSIGGGYKF